MLKAPWGLAADAKPELLKRLQSHMPEEIGGGCARQGWPRSIEGGMPRLLSIGLVSLHELHKSQMGVCGKSKNC